MSNIYRNTPLTSMDQEHLRDYIGWQIITWPGPLSHAEKGALFRVMHASVESMRERCMTPEQKKAILKREAKKAAMAAAMVDKPKPCKKKAVKVHHIFI